MPNPYQQHLLNLADRSKTLERLIAANLQAGDCARLHGLSGSAKALAIARLQQRTGRSVLVVCPNAEAAEAWYDDMEHFGIPGALHFPMSETLPYEVEEPVIEIVSRQFSTLYYLARGERPDTTKAPKADDPGSQEPSAPPLIIAPIEALHRRIPSRADFRGLFLSFWWGERFDLDATVRQLIEMGYERESITEARGEFSVRGHIVDIYPPHFENPLRFDLFGDEIESIRFFDAGTQRSIRSEDEIERAVILPARIHTVAENLAQNGKGLVTLCDWLPENAIVVLDCPEKLDEALDRLDQYAERNFGERGKPGDENKPRYPAVTISGQKSIRSKKSPAPAAAAHVNSMDEEAEVSAQSEPELALVPEPFHHEPLPPSLIFARRSEIRRCLGQFAQALIPSIDVQATGMQEPAVFDFGITSYENMPTDLASYLSLIRKKQAQDFSIHIVCDNDGQITRLDALLRDHEINTRQILSSTQEAEHFEARDVLKGYQDVTLVTGPLHTGFIFPDALLLIITDREMFGRYKRRHVYRRAYKGKPIASAEEIRAGDFVVHVDHGIGRYLGMRRQELDGRMAELIELQYSDGNKLLVPIENVGHIQKYSSVEGAAPALDSLGSKRWMARRKKSQEKIEEMAKELLEIYAQRALARGHSYSPDTVWQQEFEDSFLYQETPDQLRAIRELKADMMDSRAMDRLLCGDVGFGKTEVAMRAAFKAVQDKKQVAVLVPTTILAQQHYNTFRERFASFPIKIDVISRFRSAAEQKEVARKTKYGAVDILIGTHRILSADIQFADLGLLIIDEEHRFGVRQKEKLKALRASIDILTLSATPIPRTLYLALGGLRDMSVINTPPRDRLPIRTRVIHFVAEEVEQAVLRELNRGGQIYFVHNRVQTIGRVAKRLQEIVPQARIAIAHGQMPEHQLEEVMFDFIERKYDILLSTTIIESGLDIPNVNTIIINRADAFGLAQLYQLRGRVGRDVKRAYAYLIIPEGKPITDTAIRRLRAIEEFTELGTGFQVAMRDLEIRGTGNILGSEQHGVIETIGFDLYCQMLEDAVKRLRGQTRDEAFAVEIKWGIPALLPLAYVPVESHRIAFYKRCAAAREPRELDDFAEELRDRFGNLPQEAKNLLAISMLRLLARNAHVERVIGTPTGFKLGPRGEFLPFLRDAIKLKENDRFRKYFLSINAEAVQESTRGLPAASRGNVLFEVRRWELTKGIQLAMQILKELANPD